MISACILTRDDSGTLEACLQSIRPHVDELCIVDTGSIDNSPQIAKKYADKFSVFLDCNDPATELIEDFAMARNHALDMATGDVHVWIDGDDLLVGGEHIRGIAERMGADALILVPYDYQHDAAGRPVCVHWRETIVKPRDKWRWSIPVHEVMLPQGISPVAEPTHLVKRVHRKELSKRTPDPERNLRILKKYVAKVGEGDVRAWYYLGVEYSIRGDVSNALRILKRYIELAGWADEKCLALLEVARIYQRMGLFSEAVEWSQRAMLTKSWPEPYWTITECFYQLASAGIDEETNARRAMHFAEVGMMLPATETVLFVNPMKRFEIYALLHQLYARFGQIDRALDACKKGLEGMPDDAEMKTRALMYEDVLTKNTLVREAQKLAGINQQLQAVGAFDAAQWQQMQQMVSAALGLNLTASLPPAPIVVAEQVKADGCLDVVFFLGPQYEEWSPATLMAGGMGGSETMAWELARRLRGIGHRVRMFAQCNAQQEGVYDGVEYLDWQKYPGTVCDVLIASRRPEAVDRDLVRARVRLLWVHDVHVGPGLTPARALRTDRILALSEWHKRYLLELYSDATPGLVARLRDDDVRVTRNGVATDAFAATVERNPKRLVYSSSPDRGLQILLEMWPAILAEEPEAELRVAYGFDNWEKTAGQSGIPWLSATALRQVKHMMRSLPRITSLGRISPAALATEMLGAGVWAYPTWFSETSCITAMQAQAAGLFCVTTPVAALNETVGSYGTLVPGAWETGGSEADRAAFVAATVAAIRGENQPHTREELRAAAVRFDLDALAADWDKMIREELLESEESVVPEWRAA